MHPGAMQELARYLEASKAMQELVNENVGHYAHKAGCLETLD